ncbi:hypothetical protein ACP4OV_006890 [Aristida adscensionis]
MACYKTAMAMCLLLAVVAALPSSSLGSSTEVGEVIKACEEFIGKDGHRAALPQPGSPCCDKVKAVEKSKSICEDMTEVEKDQISLEALAKVCKSCKNPLDSGYDCRGYTVPADL